MLHLIYFILGGFTATLILGVLNLWRDEQED